MGEEDDGEREADIGENFSDEVGEADEVDKQVAEEEEEDDEDTVGE